MTNYLLFSKNMKQKTFYHASETVYIFLKTDSITFQLLKIYAFCLNAFNLFYSVLFYFVADSYIYSFWILFPLFFSFSTILFKNLFFVLMVCKRKVGQLCMEEWICHFEKWFLFTVFLKLCQNIVYSMQYLIKWLLSL